MKIQCIHFDLDSVLYLPAAFLESTLRLSIKIMVENGLRATCDEALVKLFEIREEDSNAGDHFDRLCYYFNGSFDPMIIAAGVEKYWDCKFANMMPAPHAHHVLALLAHHYPFTIITNGLPVKQAGKIIRIGLNHYFNTFEPGSGVQDRYFYASNDPATMKPQPYLWEQARKDIGFHFSQTVMVGDRYWADMFGAKHLGMATIKIQQGEHKKESIDQAYQKNKARITAIVGKQLSEKEAKKLMTPDHTIHSLCELIGIIKKIKST